MPSHRARNFVICLVLLSSCGRDRGDRDYDTSVANPAYDGEHPVLAFDEGHRERHLSHSTYTPFAELARNDGYAIDRIDDPITDGVKILRVSDDVARLVLHIAGQDVEARVGDGLAVSWVPDGTLRGEIEHSTVTAYAADGSELETGPLYPGLP